MPGVPGAGLGLWLALMRASRYPGNDAAYCDRQWALGLEEHPRARRLAERGVVNTAEKFGVDRADDLTLRQKVLLWLLPGTTRAFDALRRSA